MNKNVYLVYRKILLAVVLSGFFAFVTAKEVVVKATVKDALSGETIIGASVVIESQPSKGVLTDMDGVFTITAEESDKIVITYVGYTKSVVAVKDILRMSDKVIRLREDSKELDEVVVTGYQKIDRKMFTGAASSIKAENAKIDGVTDVSRMIQGKAAGVQITNVSGTFGAAPKIRIRGASSITGNQSPLWVVDGVVLEDVVEVSADALSTGNAATLISSAVAGLNADDIESFQILKDASATALYGARAMNGVVVISTKKGKNGVSKISYSGEFTVRTKPSYNMYNVMNSQEQMSVYLEMEQKGFFNHADISRAKNGGVFFKMYDLINTYNPATKTFGLENSPQARAEYLRGAEMNNTDWFDLLFQNTLQQNHSVSITSGNEKTNSYTSFSFFNDPGWTTSDKVNRYTVNSSSSYNFNKKLTAKLLFNGSVRNQRAPGTSDRTTNTVEGQYSRDFDINPFSYALNSSRTMDPHTTYRMNYADFNILNEIKNNYIDLDMMDVKFQADINYKPVPEVNLTALGSVRYVKSSRESKIKDNSNMALAYRAAQDATIAANNNFLYKDPDNVDAIPYSVLPEGGFYNTEDNKMLNFYARLTGDYNKIFNGKHAVNLLAGSELKYTDRTNRKMTGVGYQYENGGIPYIDYRIIRQMTEGGFDYYGMGENYDRFLSFFGTGSYSLNGTYTINATTRLDGSNRLGRSRSARWLPTWNVSGSWNIANEPFMKNVKDISTLTFRTTYGLVASMGMAQNALAIFRSQVTYRPFTDEKENQIFIESLENSELTWEKQHEFNAGIDLGMYKNRLSLSIDAYKRNSFDLIAVVRTSGIGGELEKYANYANMESSGIEFSLNTKNIQTRDFSWTTNITFAYNTNTVTNLQAKPRIIDMVLPEGAARQGYPVRGLYSVKFDGLNEEGLPTFINEYGKKTVSDIFFQERDSVAHLIYEGSIDPKYIGGAETSFQYKNFKLDFFFAYQFGNVIRLPQDFSYRYSDVLAMPNEFKNRWMVPGDEKLTNMPAIASMRQISDNPYLSYAYNAYNYSNVRVAKGDFIRLKDITFTYTSNKIAKLLKLESLQFKLVASNVWLMYSDKRLGGADPEFSRSGGVAMPMPHQYTFSMRMGL